MALSNSTLALLIGGSILTVLTVIGAPHGRPPAKAVAEATPAPAPSQITAGGFTLASVGVDLPEDETPFADTPGMAIVAANCTSCHSASMITHQPALSADQWKATVAKMRDVYHAPIADGDIAPIVSALARISHAGS